MVKNNIRLIFLDDFGWLKINKKSPFFGAKIVPTLL